MSDSPVKKLTSKIARHFGGYYLIKTDLIFCSYVFSRAASLATDSAAEPIQR
jgi:hypothetical protein